MSEETVFGGSPRIVRSPTGSGSEGSSPNELVQVPGVRLATH